MTFDYTDDEAEETEKTDATHTPGTARFAVTEQETTGIQIQETGDTGETLRVMRRARSMKCDTRIRRGLLLWRGGVAV
jgi:hypothetical protein